MAYDIWARVGTAWKQVQEIRVMRNGSWVPIAGMEAYTDEIRGTGTYAWETVKGTDQSAPTAVPGKPVLTTYAGRKTIASWSNTSSAYEIQLHYFIGDGANGWHYTFKIPATLTSHEHNWPTDVPTNQLAYVEINYVDAAGNHGPKVVSDGVYLQP